MAASQRPKYERLQDQLLEVIESLEVGAPLPPERTLAKQYAVSRMTLRHALDDLERRGYVDRRHGSGTYAARPKITNQLRIVSFTEDMRRLGMTSDSRIVSISEGTAGARLGAKLTVSPGEAVWTVGRLRLADGEPMALEWLSVPKALTPGLRLADLEHESFYALIAARYGIHLVGGRQRMEASVTDDQESGLLGVPLHSPALIVERVTWTADQEIVEFVRSTYRGDRYTFTAELHGGEGPRQ